MPSATTAANPPWPPKLHASAQQERTPLDEHLYLEVFEAPVPVGRKPLILHNPPELSDEAASQFLVMLYELATAVENHSFHQLHRYQDSAQSPQPDLFKGFDRQLPES